eukprot:jgi/Botrbrau1/8186/Bobra.357_2s0029.1
MDVMEATKYLPPVPQLLSRNVSKSQAMQSVEEEMRLYQADVEELIAMNAEAGITADTAILRKLLRITTAAVADKNNFWNTVHAILGQLRYMRKSCQLPSHKAMITPLISILNRCIVIASSEVEAAAVEDPALAAREHPSMGIPAPIRGRSSKLRGSFSTMSSPGQHAPHEMAFDFEEWGGSMGKDGPVDAHGRKISRLSNTLINPSITAGHQVQTVVQDAFEEEDPGSLAAEGSFKSTGTQEDGLQGPTRRGLLAGLNMLRRKFKSFSTKSKQDDADAQSEDEATEEGSVSSITSGCAPSI